MKTYNEALGFLRLTLDLRDKWAEKIHGPYSAPELVNLAIDNANYYQSRFGVIAEIISFIYDKEFKDVVEDTKKKNPLIKAGFLIFSLQCHYKWRKMNVHQEERTRKNEIQLLHHF